MAEPGSGNTGSGAGGSSGNVPIVDRGKWGSRWGFILAAAGSAVGLGNIWKFPYITGENGGGLFVLIYLVCIALVGVPIMMAEIMIGRSAQRQPVAAFHFLEGGRSGWSAVGWLGVIGGFVILSYYVVVAGWAADYALKSVVNFVSPIEEEAKVEGTVHRVTVSETDMRTKLTKLHVASELREPVSMIQRQLPGSFWRGYDRYETAMHEFLEQEWTRIRRSIRAADRDLWQEFQNAEIQSDVFEARQAVVQIEAMRKGYEEAREILFEDETLAAQVVAVEKLIRDEIVPAVEKQREDSKKLYKKIKGKPLRDEAEQVHRREQIVAEVGERFDLLEKDGWTSSFWSLLLMIITISIVSAGISAGIERACKVLMPLLIVLICSMVVYGMFQPGFGSALQFVFSPDASKLKASGVLEALGHAFFTLSLGMGAMITYGSYQKSKERLAGQSILIAGLDTIIALLACMMIFPIIFSYGQPAGAGPGLVFKSMPLAFAEIGRGGMLLAIIFFGLLVFAALTSMISLLEVSCSYFIDERRWTRRRAATVVGAGVFLFSLPSAFSASADMAMTSWEPGFGQSFFATMDYLASNWMLPLGGLLISVYAGWVMPKRMRDAELVGLSPLLIQGWLTMVRFVAPALVLLVLCQRVGILQIDELLY